MSTKTKISKAKQAKALAIVAGYLGPQMGYDGPAPTGETEARFATGPQLVPDWDWPSSGPTPTVLLEGGPEEWAYYASADKGVQQQLRDLGLWPEPYASYALCLHPL